MAMFALVKASSIELILLEACLRSVLAASAGDAV
jgi:hypothetical protein